VTVDFPFDRQFMFSAESSICHLSTGYPKQESFPDFMTHRRAKCSQVAYQNRDNISIIPNIT